MLHYGVSELNYLKLTREFRSRCLTELNLFETTSYSGLDADRTELYRVEAQRRLSEKQFTNPADYLTSSAPAGYGRRAPVERAAGLPFRPN